MFKEGKIKADVFERMMKDFDDIKQDNRIENDMLSKQIEFKKTLEVMDKIEDDPKVSA